MDLAQLKTDYAHLHKMLKWERAMRERYRAQSEAERRAKLDEIDKALAIVERWKDKLKAQCEPEPEQAGLFGGKDDRDD